MCFYCNRVDAVSDQRHNLDSRERFSRKVSKLGCILAFTYVSLLHEFWVRWVVLFCFHISHGAWLFHPLLLSLYVKGLWIWTDFLTSLASFWQTILTFQLWSFIGIQTIFFQGGGGGESFAKKFSQVAHISLKQWKRNKGHMMHYLSLHMKWKYSYESIAWAHKTC